MRKKKLLAILVSLCCVASLTACNDNEKEESSVFNAGKQEKEETETVESESETADSQESIEETETTPAVETTEETEPDSSTVGTTISASYPTNIVLSDDLYSFQVSVNGVVYQFPMWYSDFESLGYVYQGSETDMISSNEYTWEDWKRDGVSFSTYIGNFALNTSPASECEVLGMTFDKYDMDDCDYEVILPGGIQYGVSTKEDVLAAYGTPSSDYDGDLYYKMEYELDTYKDIEIYIWKDTGTVREISLRNFVKLEGGNDEVSSEVTAEVLAYTAPSSIGADLYSFDFEIEGHLYSLPCPVSELINNGFTIDQSNSDEYVAAGSSGHVTLRYNNQSIRLWIDNPSDYATIPEYCFFKDFETGSDNYDPTFSVVTPGGITLGTKEDDLLAAIGDLYYETYEGTYYKSYTVYDNNRSSSNYYCFSVNEGVVDSIEIQKWK